MKRDEFTLPLGLDAELLIDNFAGGGGASEGIEQAFGRHVDVAINHDGEALAMHAANHPHTAHHQEDVFDIHPGFVTGQRPIGLAWFSPDCKHHSKAKGGKPREKNIRGLAWVTLKWGTFQMPRCIALENVEEFQDWGPLDANGYPIKALKGRTFKAFINALTTGIAKDHPDVPEIFEALGADFPMERLYAGLGYKVEYRILRACDYSTPTIRKRLFVFARRDGLPIRWPAPTHGNPKLSGFKESKLQPWRTAAECIDWSIRCPSIFERKRPLKDATLRRIAKGIMKFVVNSSDPFIVKFSENSTGQHTDEPLHTVMAGAPRFGLVSPTLMHLTHQGADRTQSVDDPLPTVTSAHRGEQALIAATLVKQNSAILAPFITEHANASTQRNIPLDEPLRTQCAEVKGGHFALVSAMLAKHYGGVVGTGVDVPFGTVTTSDHHSVVTAHVTKFRNGSIGTDIEEPLHTICAGGEQARPGTPGAMGLVTSSLIKLRGTCQHGQPVDEPMATISAQGTHIGEVRAFMIKYYSEGGQWQDPRDPMHTVPTKDRIGLVTIKGEDYAIVDIGMRMLTPRELARAQGFPDTYILDPIVNGKPLTKTAQVRMIGNSVCPPLARALLESNFTHEKEIARVA